MSGVRVRWLDDAEQRAWRAFVRMQHELESRLNRDLVREAGLSLSDYEVLAHLSEAEEGQLRLFQLAEATTWEKSRLSHHLTRMQRRGLVSREVCATDARGSFVVITAKGREAIEAAAPLHVAGVRRFFVDALSPNQLDAVRRAAERVLQALDDGDDRS